MTKFHIFLTVALSDRAEFHAPPEPEKHEGHFLARLVSAATEEALQTHLRRGAGGVIDVRCVARTMPTDYGAAITGEAKG